MGERALLTREGEYWTLASGDSLVRVRDTKGMRYLAALVAKPDVELHALDLVAAVEGGLAAGGGARAEAELELVTDLGDAGEALDPAAKEAYRRRVEELREELEEAESWGDPERVAAAKQEMDFIAAELAAAVGLGGRDRKAASAAERARVNVTRAIKSSLKKVAEHDAELGRALELGVKTGTFCSYRPGPGFEVVLAGGRSAKATAPGPPAAEGGPQPSRTLVSALIGREAELGQLERALDDARAGRGSLHLLAGEPGVGKTRLADALSARARDERALVLWGRCWEGGGAPAFWPWVQVIREYLREEGAEGVVKRMGAAAGQLTQLVPELGEGSTETPAPSIESEQARFVFFDAVTRFLRQVSSERALVVVLDDLHAADDPSLLLLDFLVRELQAASILVVGTYRPSEGEHAVALLGRLMPYGHPIQLTGLSEGAVGSFVEERTGTPAPAPLVKALHSATEGNPFFMEEVLRLLVAQGLLEQPEAVPRQLPVPQSVREAIRRRLQPLPEESARLLQLAAVLGKEFTLPALEGASELPPGRVLELLDEAILRGLVAEVTDALGRFRFVHALIREALYENLSATARIELHQRVGEGLEAAYAEYPEPHIEELAHHFLQAAPAGDVDKAVRYARRAGDRALSLLAFEEAVRWYERALQALDLKESADRDARCELLLALGAALMGAGDPDPAKEAFAHAGELARRLRDPEREARAALGYAGRYWATGVVDPSVVSMLERSLAALGDREGLLKAELLGRLATEVYYSASPERSDSLSAEAVRIARGVGDPGALASVLTARLAAAWRPENLEERLALATEIVRLADRAGDRETGLRGRAFRVSCLLEHGDVRDADIELEAAAGLAEELRQPRLLWHTRGLRALRELMAGRFEQGERFAEQALEAGRHADESNARHYYGIQMTTCRYNEGRLEEIEPLIRGFVEKYPNLAAWRSTLALLYAELGREADARREFEIAAANDWDDVPRDSIWTATLYRAAETCVRLGDTARAAHLYRLLLPFAERPIVVGRVASVYLGANSRLLGLLAATMGRRHEAAEHFEYALALDARMGAHPWVAQSQLDYARVLASEDPRRASELLDQALETARELGMVSVARQAAEARAAV